MNRMNFLRYNTLWPSRRSRANQSRTSHGDERTHVVPRDRFVYVSTHCSVAYCVCDIVLCCALWVVTMANLTLRYLDELSYVLNSRRHLATQAKASSVGDLLNAEEDRFTPVSFSLDFYTHGIFTTRFQHRNFAAILTLILTVCERRTTIGGWTWLNVLDDLFNW